MADDKVLMQHNETQGIAYFPAGAVELWRPKGWTPVDELAAAASDPDTAEEAAPESEAEQAGTPDEQATKPPAKRRGTDNEEKA